MTIISRMPRVIQVFLTSESPKHQPPSFLRGTKVALPQITRQIQRPARKGHTALSGTVPNRRTIVPFAKSIFSSRPGGIIVAVALFAVVAVWGYFAVT
jgi:hypothetical protein